jgi:hypothetical protein
MKRLIRNKNFLAAVLLAFTVALAMAQLANDTHHFWTGWPHNSKLAGSLDIRIGPVGAGY